VKPFMTGDASRAGPAADFLLNPRDPSWPGTPYRFRPLLDFDYRQADHLDAPAGTRRVFQCSGSSISSISRPRGDAQPRAGRRHGLQATWRGADDSRRLAKRQ
jgi:hypothetical protein